MLTPVLDLFRLSFTTLQAAARSRQELVLENLLLRHQTRGAHPSDSTPTAA